MPSYIDFGGYKLPVYDQKDLYWSPAEYYDADGTQYREENYGGDSGSFQVPYTVKKGDVKTPSQFTWDESLAQKYGDLYGFKKDDNWTIEGNPTETSFRAKLKSGDKEGTLFDYNLANGQWTPTYAGTVGWDTNAEQRKRNLAFAALATAGMGIEFLPGMLEGLGTGFGAGASTGIGGTVGQGTLAELMSSGLGAGATPGAGMTATGAAGTLGDLGATLGTLGVDTGALGSLGGVLPTGAAGTLGGTFGGLTQVGMTTLPLAGQLGTGITALGAAPIGAAPTVWQQITSALTGNAAAGSAAAGLSPSAIKALATLGGGLIGKLTGGSDGGGGSGGGSGPTGGPVQTPTMYGGAGGFPSFQTYGNSDTERYMTQQYLPGVFKQGASQGQSASQGPTLPPLGSYASVFGSGGGGLGGNGTPTNLPQMASYASVFGKDGAPPGGLTGSSSAMGGLLSGGENQSVGLLGIAPGAGGSSSKEEPPYMPTAFIPTTPLSDDFWQRRNMMMNMGY